MCGFMNIAYGAAQYNVGKNPTDIEYQADQDDDQYKYKEPTKQMQINEQTDWPIQV